MPLGPSGGPRATVSLDKQMYIREALKDKSLACYQHAQLLISQLSFTFAFCSIFCIPHALTGIGLGH